MFKYYVEVAGAAHVSVLTFPLWRSFTSLWVCCPVCCVYTDFILLLSICFLFSYCLLSSESFHVSPLCYNLSLSSLSSLSGFLLWHSYLPCALPDLHATFLRCPWHLSAIIWSGNCCNCLGLCFCLPVCPLCAFSARPPEADSLLSFQSTC